MKKKNAIRKTTVPAKWPASARVRKIPRGFRPKAQGCEARATLGNRPRSRPNPNGIATFSPAEPEEMDQADISRLSRSLPRWGRWFFLAWKSRGGIFQTASGKLAIRLIGQTVSDQLNKPQTGSRIEPTQDGSAHRFTLMYVNYFDRYVKRPEENPTIGLLLCKEKKDAIVKLTLPAGAHIHAKEYQLYLPSKELLRRKLLEWTRDTERTA